MSWAGMPSVMVTMSSTPASTASYMASVAKRGGTNMRDTFAPVSSTAALTVSKTGMPSTSCPPFPGVTPPTIRVPKSRLRSAWKEPSRPVRPCSTTLEFLSMSIATSAPSVKPSGPRALPLCVPHQAWSLPRTDCPGRHPPNGSAFRLVGAVQAYNDGHLDSHLLHSGEDTPRHLVATRDSPEYVEEDSLDLSVGSDDLQSIDYLACLRSTAHIQEIRRTAPGICHNVQGTHHQAGSVTQHADRPVQLDVGHTLLVGQLFLRIRGAHIPHLRHLTMTI